MIAEICFTADWLERKRTELGGVDPALLERALHAFALLGHLAESDLEFVFKGGTSLLLHVPVIRRLSIDIDILCAAPAEVLDRSTDGKNRCGQSRPACQVASDRKAPFYTTRHSNGPCRGNLATPDHHR